MTLAPVDSKPPTIESVGVLHRGLLLALATLRRSFVADGEKFHDAYGAVMRGWEFPACREARESHDPVFGVYREAEAMILEGMRDCILALESPRLTRALFKISERHAHEELAGYNAVYGWRTTMHEMATLMDERLR